MKRWRHVLALGFASALLLVLLAKHGESDSRWGDVSAAYLGGIVGMVLVYSIRHAPRVVGSSDAGSKGNLVAQSLVALAVSTWLGLRKADWSAWPAAIGAWMLGLAVTALLVHFEKKAVKRAADSSLTPAADPV